MPLSKARDRVRKHKERAKSRLDKLLCSPQTLNPVQPNNHSLRQPSPLRDVVTRASGDTVPIQIDADGNPIYEY